MKRIGIVLAGGEATRLPNKPLLPLRNLRPAITSSIDLFLRSGVDAWNVVVVVPPHSAIPDVVDALRYEAPFTYVIQPRASGVPHALALAVKAVDPSATTYVLMSCCDNVYAREATVPREDEHDMTPYAAVRGCPAWQRSYLSMYDRSSKEWCNKCPGDTCIAGWWRMPAVFASMGEPDESSVHFLNRIGAKPDEMSSSDPWWDIGVLEPYVAYWRNGSNGVHDG